MSKSSENHHNFGVENNGEESQRVYTQEELIDIIKNDTEMHGKLLKLCRSITAAQPNPEADAQEIFNTTLINAWRSPGFDGRKNASLTTWLGTIARNAFLDKLRKSKTNRGLNHNSLSLSEPGNLTVAENVLLKKESVPSTLHDADILKQAMAKLKNTHPEWYKAIELKEIKGHSVGEAAEILGTHENTLRVHVHRAKAELKKIYKKIEKQQQNKLSGLNK